jgi:hypothetical protein
VASRVDTPLSKALLATGAIDAQLLEEAVQAQQVHGGSLDTILLEKAAVDERTLADLLSKAWGTDPVALDVIEKPATNAVKALPERMALAMKLCPFAVEGTAVHVMCSSPLDRGLVEEVSALLAKPLVPHVVPEVRLWQGLQHAYGTAPDERFAALLSDLRAPTKAGDASSEGAPIEDELDLPEPMAARWDLVEALAHLAANEAGRDGIVKVAVSYARKHMPFAAMIGIRFVDERPQCVGWLRSGPSEGVQFENKPFWIPPDSALDAALKSPSPSLGKPALTPGNAALFGWLGRRRPKTFLVVPVVVAGKPVGALVADSGVRSREIASLSELVAFAARLGPAFESLLRQRRSAQSTPPEPAPSAKETAGAPARSGSTELEGSAQLSGERIAQSETKKEVRRGHSISADIRETTKPFFDIHSEVTAPGPLIQPSPADDAKRVTIDVEITVPMPMLKGLGPGVDLVGDDVPAPPPLPEPSAKEPRPITMFAMPAVTLEPPSREKSSKRETDGTSPFAKNYVQPKAPEPPPPPPPPPPAVVVVDGFAALANANIPSPAFHDVVEAKAADAWRGALEEAVERGHQGGTVAPEDKARLFIGEDGWEDVRYESYDGSAPASPAISLGIVTEADGTPVTEEDAPMPSLDELVDQLDALDDVTVERARKQILSRSTDALAALEARFPGRLRVDPFDPGESVRTAANLGPLVDVLFALGPAGLDAAVPHLDSRYPAHRYAAVLLFTLTPDDRAIDLLRARLHDQEPKIRALAAEALAPFVAHPRFEHVLIHLRERLQSPLLDARRRAVQLLGAFRDVGAVPLLVALLDAKVDLAEDARQSLRAITLQDFGVRSKGWDKWWSKAKKKSRVDWLIEGLSSEDRELRTIAHAEMTAITGDDFGYRPDEPKRNRERAVAVFQTWWAEEQKKAS